MKDGCYASDLHLYQGIHSEIYHGFEEQDIAHLYSFVFDLLSFL